MQLLPRDGLLSCSQNDGELRWRLAAKITNKRRFNCRKPLSIIQSTTHCGEEHNTFRAICRARHERRWQRHNGLRRGLGLGRLCREIIGHADEQGARRGPLHDGPRGKTRTCQKK
jgi:hypothetical protein